MSRVVFDRREMFDADEHNEALKRAQWLVNEQKWEHPEYENCKEKIHISRVGDKVYMDVQLIDDERIPWGAVIGWTIFMIAFIWLFYS